jgi:exodeoxyribonuclease III
MRIATFNANSIRSRLPVILDWLRTHAPDVLAVQETKVVDGDFPALAFAEAGYHVVFRGEKSYNGVALISREKPQAVRFGLDDDGPADATRLVQAKVGSVFILNTYVPQGRDIEHAMFQYKLAWFKRLRAYFDRHFTQRARVVWVGDLNIAPEAIDIHNAAEQQNHVCHHVDVRKAFAQAASWGFVDVYRMHHPEAGRYSYFDYRTVNAVQRKMGWRVDHILATRPLAAKCTDASIDLKPRQGDKPSDHTFVMADFDV